MPGPLSWMPILNRDWSGLLDVDPDLGQDAGLLAGVERVVDRLLDRGQQRLARVVEAEQVAVLGEELADRDVALRRRHRLGRGAAPGLRWLAVGLGSGLTVSVGKFRGATLFLFGCFGPRQSKYSFTAIGSVLTVGKWWDRLPACR